MVMLLVVVLLVALVVPTSMGVGIYSIAWGGKRSEGRSEVVPCGGLGKVKRSEAPSEAKTAKRRMVYMPYSMGRMKVCTTMPMMMMTCMWKEGMVVGWVVAVGVAAGVQRLAGPLSIDMLASSMMQMPPLLLLVEGSI